MSAANDLSVIICATVGDVTQCKARAHPPGSWNSFWPDGNSYSLGKQGPVDAHWLGFSVC